MSHKLLVDSALSKRVADELRRRGHDVTHTTDLGLGSADDSVILEAAIKESRIVVSADTDFGALLAVYDSHEPSFVLLRMRVLCSFAEQARLIDVALRIANQELLAGAVVVIEDHRVRVRRLPVGATQDWASLEPARKSDC